MTVIPSSPKGDSVRIGRHARLQRWPFSIPLSVDVASLFFFYFCLNSFNPPWKNSSPVYCIAVMTTTFLQLRANNFSFLRGLLLNENLCEVFSWHFRLPANGIEKYKEYYHGSVSKGHFDWIWCAKQRLGFWKKNQSFLLLRMLLHVKIERFCLFKICQNIKKQKKRTIFGNLTLSKRCCDHLSVGC